MDRVKLCCPCMFGLESILKYEVGKIGGESIEVQDGKVTFEGDVSIIARANLWLRTAERVLLLLAEFDCYSFETLFEKVKELPWKEYVGLRDAFPVKGYALNSKLHSVPDCQSIIKKAIVERLRLSYQTDWFEETGSKVQVQFSIHKDRASIMIDTSGPGLHKRGYRKDSNAAPIKETLAAGIVDLARVRGDSVVYDPMCGSGTLLIEAAMKALNIAPGIHRAFAAESHGYMGEGVWKRERQAALEQIDRTATFKGYGFDVDEEAVTLTVQNMKKAGVAPKLKVQQQDVRDFRPEEPGILLVNPPYGERMLDIKGACELYESLGRVVDLSLLKAYIISPSEQFEEFFGKKADRKRKLYNGMLKCDLYMYFKN